MANKRLSFNEWMALVSKMMERMCGVGPDDLPDWKYRTAYDTGVDAATAAKRAVKAAKSF